MTIPLMEPSRHVEGIEITYDTNETSYKELLDYFFRVHDPTTIDQQEMICGAVTARLFLFKTNRREAGCIEVINIVDNSNRWSGNVVCNNSGAYW